MGGRASQGKPGGKPQGMERIAQARQGPQGLPVLPQKFRSQVKPGEQPMRPPVLPQQGGY
jgi:hypothetical protein